MDGIEHPNTSYTISAKKLTEIISGIVSSIPEGNTFDFCDMFTQLEEYSKPSITARPRVSGKIYEPSVPTFRKKTVDGLFWVPSENSYRNIKISIQKSTITGAGMGAYALEDIPKGARASYFGLAKSDTCANMYYAWTIRPFDPVTGIPKDSGALFFIDASNPKFSNWTRYVNTGLREKNNNFDVDQLFDKIYYIANRDISAGEELFIDYGDDYRRVNLGMKGKY